MKEASIWFDRGEGEGCVSAIIIIIMVVIRE